MTAIDSLTPEHVAALLQRQDALQAEARRVLADLNLASILSQAGEPVQLGSSVVGLMTWRDIDIHVYCSARSSSAIYKIARTG